MVKDGWGINSKGEVFYRKLQNQKLRKKIIHNDDGSITEETYTPEPEPFDVPISETGWKKVVQTEDILLIKIPDAENYGKDRPQLFHFVFEVSANDYFRFNPCSYCTEANFGNKWHYLRDMESGVHPICIAKAIRFNVSAGGSIQTVADREGSLCKWVKLKSKTKVSKQEAMAILTRLQKKPNLDVAMYLQGLEVV